MDIQYLIWLGIPVLGAVLGLFIQPKFLVWFCVALFAMAILGIFVGYNSGHESSGFAFGVVSMAIPFVSALLIGGAAISRAVLTRAKKKKEIDDTV